MYEITLSSVPISQRKKIITDFSNANVSNKFYNIMLCSIYEQQNNNIHHNNSSNKNDNSLSVGAVSGIALSGCVIAFLLGFGIWYLKFYKNG